MHTSFTDNETPGRFSGETAPAKPQADLQQLLAASALIVRLERIASSGVLSEADERDTREIICKACRAFAIPSIAERPASNIIPLDEATEALVRRQIEIVTRKIGA